MAPLLNHNTYTKVTEYLTSLNVNISNEIFLSRLNFKLKNCSSFALTATVSSLNNIPIVFVLKEQDDTSFKSSTDSNSKPRTSKALRSINNINEVLRLLQTSNSKHLLSDLNHCSRLVASSFQPFHGFISTFILNEVLKTQFEPYLAIALFEWAKSQPRFFPNVASYSIIIRICGRAKLYDCIENYLSEMKINGVSVNAHVFNELIKSYGRGNQLEKALSYFEEMKSMNFASNIFTYSIMIDLMAKEGDYDKARELFQETKRLGMSANAKLKNTMISVCGRLGFLDEALAIYESMNQPDSEPNLLTFSSLIDLLQKAGRFRDAIELYEEMLRKEIKPDIVTFTSLLHMKCTLGCPDSDISNLLMDMDAAGVTPDVVWCSILIHRYVKEGRTDLAESVFHKMKSKSISPNVVLLCSLFEGYLKTGSYEKMDALLEEMHRVESTPDLNAYTHVLRFINGSREEKQREYVWKLLEKLNHPIHNVVTHLLRDEPSSPSLNPTSSPDPFFFFDFSQMLTCLRDSKRDLVLPFSDVLIECMLNRNLFTVCVDFWKEIEPLGLWKHPTKPASLQWKLDVRGMSRTMAKFIVRMEILSLHESLLLGSETYPISLVIITGKPKGGASSEKHMSLQFQVKAFLDAIHSPFVCFPYNPGRLVAEGWQVKYWLQQEDTVFQLRSFN